MRSRNTIWLPPAAGVGPWGWRRWASGKCKAGSPPHSPWLRASRASQQKVRGPRDPRKLPSAQRWRAAARMLLFQHGLERRTPPSPGWFLPSPQDRGGGGPWQEAASLNTTCPGRTKCENIRSLWSWCGITQITRLGGLSPWLSGFLCLGRLKLGCSQSWGLGEPWSW